MLRHKTLRFWLFKLKRNRVSLFAQLLEKKRLSYSIQVGLSRLYTSCDQDLIRCIIGIRGGADVFKVCCMMRNKPFRGKLTLVILQALALGAKAVLVGRLWIYGMGIAGEAGVRHVMRSLLADFDILFAISCSKHTNGLLISPSLNNSYKQNECRGLQQYFRDQPQRIEYV